MFRWYYYDNDGTKVGPVTSTELQALAQRGTVTPETRIENKDGKTGTAKNVKGLTFPETTAPASETPTPMQASPTPVVTPKPTPSAPRRRNVQGFILGGGAICAVLVGLLGFYLGKSPKEPPKPVIAVKAEVPKSEKESIKPAPPVPEFEEPVVEHAPEPPAELTDDEKRLLQQKYPELDWTDANVIVLPEPTENGLRQALAEAAETEANDFIVVRTTEEKHRIVLENGFFTIKHEQQKRGWLTILALGPKKLVLDGDGKDRILLVESVTANFGDIIFANGFVVDDVGAAVKVHGCWSARFFHCDFTGNVCKAEKKTAWWDNFGGAGLFVGVSHLVLRDVLFEENQIDYRNIVGDKKPGSGTCSAGLFANGAFSLTLTNVVFRNNDGGTMFALSAKALLMKDISVIGNKTLRGDVINLRNHQDSEGAYQIVNLFATGNTTDSDEDVFGTLCLSGRGRFRLDHVTIADNSYVTDGSAILLTDNVGRGGVPAEVTISNSIIAGNRRKNGSDSNFEIRGSDKIEKLDIFNCITSTDIPEFAEGRNNLVVKREDLKLGELRDFGNGIPVMPLLEGSPAIDAGTVTENMPKTDLVGKPRNVGKAPDIGAFECQEIFAPVQAAEIPKPTPQEPPEPAPERHPPMTEAQMLEALYKKTELELDKSTTFEQLFEMIVEKNPGFDIALDPKAAAKGFTLDSPAVRRPDKFSDVTLRFALNGILSHYGLTCAMRDGVLWVTTQETIERDARYKVPPLYSEAERRDFGNREKNLVTALEKKIDFDLDEDSKFEDLFRMITDQIPGIHIAMDPRGAGALGISSRSPVVREPVKYEGIMLRTALWMILREQDLTCRIKDGRLWITTEDVAAGDTKHNEAPMIDDPERRVANALNKSIELALDENTTFKKLYVMIAEKNPGLHIYQDPRGFENLRIRSSSPAAHKPLKFNRVKLRDALLKILGEQKLAYVVVGDVLVITSMTEAPKVVPQNRSAPQNKAVPQNKDRAPRDPAVKPWTINGRVVDEKGRPIAGVYVVLSQRTPQGNLTEIKEAGRPKVNANGEYSFFGIAPDTYELSVRQSSGNSSAAPTVRSPALTQVGDGWQFVRKFLLYSAAQFEIRPGENPRDIVLETPEDGLTRKEKGVFLTTALMPRSVAVEMVFQPNGSVNFNKNVMPSRAVLTLHPNELLYQNGERSRTDLAFDPPAAGTLPHDLAVCIRGGKYAFAFNGYSGNVDFNSVLTVDPVPIKYQTVPCEVNRVYVVKTRNGNYAKIVVRSINILDPKEPVTIQIKAR